MRIAYVCADPGIPVFGSKGASVHVREMLRAMTRDGARIDLYAARVGGEMPSGLGGSVHVHQLPTLAGDGDTSSREMRALSAAEALKGRFGSDGPFDLVYERYSLWSAAGMEFAKNRGVPSVLEVNAPLIDEQARHRTLVNRGRAMGVALRAFGAAGTIAAVSEGVASWVRGLAPDSADRLHVVPNGVDPGRFIGASPATERRSGEFVVGFVGTLKPWHGLECLVDAFAMLRKRMPSARLLVVGDGPERARLEDRLAELGAAGSATFTGAVEPDEIPAWLAAMDAAVAPYPQMRGFYFSPLKVFEYMAASLPIVASRIGQVEEILRDEETALLTAPGDAAALAAALERLSSDAALRRRLGNAARSDSALHTWDGVYARILGLAGVFAEVAR